MSAPIVFITGSTGFIGAQVTLAALCAGYNVRLSVRRSTQTEGLRQAFHEFDDKLDFVVIPDYTIAGAFDSALKDVHHIIHLASPLPKPGEDLLTPAVKGTTSVLESAHRTPSVKTVVITASVASLIPLGKGADGLVVTESIDKEELSFDHSIVPSLEPFGQYHASKLASYTATLDFVASKSPRFSTVTLHPVFVFGPSLLQYSPEELSGTNAMLFGSLYSEEPMFAPFRGVHVLDVAEAHIKALHLPQRAISSYLLSAKDRSWEEVLDFVKEEFPTAGFKAKAKSGDRWNVDTTRAQNELGLQSWREMEVQVKDVVDQQLKLRASEASRANKPPA
ncbi:NAD dependent epimerase/dehydratase family protein [Aaosphaeria arxii CBS 175.79]|uniref:NAD dependent epimerase/dehydratase family protein n=1 Tax=Aaosphaeria arxii CBS 175.79 TaxID=1450172 RepID=A0A6A5XD39_9PLEO|nr:NAD dependent epimerase/dehydratase family protein [Aaosphaeria arxii CBS 175.79]KAF2010908.1 NAD dependent epimerase/dehydratase family protein [Aaosphaeria arxii CBS 175.79]